MTEYLRISILQFSSSIDRCSYLPSGFMTLAAREVLQITIQSMAKSDHLPATETRLEVDWPRIFFLAVRRGKMSETQIN